MARKTRDDETKEPRRVARADELYGLPLDQFTAARDRLAKALREDGDRDAAAQVKALRKPTTTVWAVNQLVRRQPRKMEGYFKAADRLRAAQRAAFGPGGGEGLRKASEELRSLIAELVGSAEEVLEEAGARADVKALEAVRAILQATPTAPDRERRRLERGTLTEPLRPAQFSEVLAMMGGGRGGLRLVPPPEEEDEEEAPKKKKKAEKDKKAARRAAEEERARRLSAERERVLARRAAKKAEEEERAQKLYAQRERAREAEARRAREVARREARREAKAAERAAATARRTALAAERAEEAALRAREQADAAEEAAETARARAAEAEQRLAEAELVEEPRTRRASRR